MRLDRELQRLLASELCAILSDCTNSEVSTCLVIHPARVSELRRGDLSRFSIGKLVNLLARQHYDVEVVVRPSPIPVRTMRKATVRVARLDRLGKPLG